MTNAEPAITAIPFPPGDAMFAMRVHEALADAAGLRADEAIERVCRALRGVHPDVLGRLRSDIAGFAPSPVIYLFRDGSAHRRYSEDWISDPSTARVVTDSRGLYVDANEAAARLYGVARDRIVGETAGTFTRPDSRISDLAGMWNRLELDGELHSLAVIARADGTDVSVEFLTIRDRDGAGRHVTYLRPSGG